MRLTFSFPVMMVILLVQAGPVWAQSSRERATAPAPPVQAATSANPYSGKWTYRSYLNQPSVMVDGDPQKALDLIFGEGVMTFETPVGATLKGTFDMGDGYVLDLTGAILGEPSTAPPVVRISGIGRQGTPTEGWEYDYVGYLAWTWPNGIGQVPAIVGTVIRAKPHGQAKAGFVASFVATKQQ